MASMSVVDNGSEAIGSAGTGSGSRTGSGGDGGRVPAVVELAAGGGVVGRATGGFFLAHPLAPTNAIAAITNTRRLCIIVSIPSEAATRRSAAEAAREGARPVHRVGSRYCDQFGYRFIPDRVI
jgi:hypothetical protein